MSLIATSICMKITCMEKLQNNQTYTGAYSACEVAKTVSIQCNCMHHSTAKYLCQSSSKNLKKKCKFRIRLKLITLNNSHVHNLHVRGKYASAVLFLPHKSHQGFPPAFDWILNHWSGKYLFPVQASIDFK